MVLGKLYKFRFQRYIMDNHKPHEGLGKELQRFEIPSVDVKRDLYERAIVEIKDRVKDVDSVVPRMATIVAILKSTMPHYFWSGFYFAEENEMIIGPYQGSCACPNISYTGVCGTSARRKETVIVPDVHKFPGHIACDERSKSEIVVPLFDEKGRVIAVFDVDSSELNAFDEIDKEYLEKIMPILLERELF